MPGDSLSCTKRKYRKHKRTIVMLIEIWVYYQLKTITLRQSGSDSAKIFTFPWKDWKTSSAKALIAQNPQYNLSHIDLDSLYWAQSLFRRMGFKKRMQATGKLEIPEGARKEAELLYLQNIVTIVEKYEIPHSLITNLDHSLKVHTCNEAHYGKTKLYICFYCWIIR